MQQEQYLTSIDNQNTGNKFLSANYNPNPGQIIASNTNQNLGQLISPNSNLNGGEQFLSENLNQPGTGRTPFLFGVGNGGNRGWALGPILILTSPPQRFNRFGSGNSNNNNFFNSGFGLNGFNGVNNFNNRVPSIQDRWDQIYNLLYFSNFN